MLKELPANCPNCGRIAFWSPLKVCCTNCFFQTAKQFGESTADVIRRWNRAVVDGEGLYDITLENRIRESARATGFFGRIFGKKDAEQVDELSLI